MFSLIKLFLLYPLYINPYCASQILPILCYVPSVTKVMLLYFIHTLLSIAKMSDTIVLQKFCNSACTFNIVNLASKCRAEFRLSVDIQFVGYS